MVQEGHGGALGQRCVPPMDESIPYTGLPRISVGSAGQSSSGPLRWDVRPSYAATVLGVAGARGVRKRKVASCAAFRLYAHWRQVSVGPSSVASSKMSPLHRGQLLRHRAMCSLPSWPRPSRSTHYETWATGTNRALTSCFASSLPCISYST